MTVLYHRYACIYPTCCTVLISPQYIALHVRHGDFLTDCRRSKNECVTPLKTWAQQVRDVQHELLDQKNIKVNHVIMTSDEEDPEWWDHVAALGWLKIERDVQRLEDYGGWYCLSVLSDQVQLMTIFQA
jgi:hypothetical protein